MTDSRLAAEGRQIRRRRECLQCGERFTTFETAELVMPHVVKSDGSREPFDAAKLAAGMQKALEKRPVSSEAVDQAVERVCHRLRMLGEREVPSSTCAISGAGTTRTAASCRCCRARRRRERRAGERLAPR